MPCNGAGAQNAPEGSARRDGFAPPRSARIGRCVRKLSRDDPVLPIDADLAGGTAVLTDAAWDAIRPILERRIKKLILSGT